MPISLTSALASFDALVPYVVGNPFIPHWPHPKQALLLGGASRHDYSKEPVFECLYGGAAGGGKSDALLMFMAQYAWRFPHFRGVLIRRTHTELMKADALISRAMEWWPAHGVRWDGTYKTFHFPNGARVEMGYHATLADNARYQGGAWHAVGFDELTHWPDERAYGWLRSRIRKSVDDPIPLQLLSASNPGSAGHDWVKRRFVGSTDITTGAYRHPVAMYIRATIDDNPSLDREAYKRTLMHLHPTVRDQLLRGDWDAREPGQYYRAEWFGPMLGEEDKFPKRDRIAVRWWDLAASEREEAARTAGVLMARHRKGARMIEHAVAFRATPGKRDARILQQAMIDGHDVVVGLEVEGGSGGPAQFETLSKLLRSHGYRVTGARPRAELTDVEGKLFMRTPTSSTGKEARSAPVASCLERGAQKRGETGDSGEPYYGCDAGKHPSDETDGIRLVAGPWTQAYLDEVEGFPDVELKDLADATAGAWAYLEAHSIGGLVPTETSRERKTESHDAHPDDRRELEESLVNRRGVWLP
jgi:phage terminase large subunit-like protein